MINRFLSPLLLLLAWAALPVNAASVSLDPESAQVNPGGTFTVNVFLNAPEVAGAHPGAFCGVIEIDYDPNLITFTGFTPNSGVNITGDPIVGSRDGLETIAIAFTDAPDVGVVGTYNFEFNGGPNETAMIGIADADDFFGSFANHLPTNQPFVPDFIGASVFSVPVPAGAWLIASGLAVFGSFARRRR